MGTSGDAQSASLRLAGELRQRIVEGGWSVGVVLPTEFALAEEFGVSRATVREALSALQFAGHVESRRRRGTVVVSASPVPGLARHVNAAASFEEVVDLLEARLVLEPMVLAYAASDPDPEALDLAHDAVAGMRVVATGGQEVEADTDHRVHAMMVGTCRNPDLRDAVTTLLDRASGPWWRQSQASAWRADGGMQEVWSQDHARILRAIEAGDASAAARISRRHLLSAAENAAAMPDMPPSLRRRLRLLPARFADPA